ncbi:MULTISPECIES: 4-hydroxybenzoate octaprenyltransferase [Cysteiniphilum]|uniref:4-hydroxybenzoate octaprenyltransferase n=1 Tax=Cysteiniphilum TaxID=2056696 RepID=UPI00177E6078|nr:MULTISPECIES: 4-hydroxybenzoate octaprenyltransferase [Cysteiniphilum]
MKAYFYLMRLHRPIPILIILYPTLWGLFAATPALPSFKIFIIFVLGVIIMRTAGCIFNDIADRDFDGQVKRTATRPIATGEISVKQAAFVGVLLLVIAFILVLQLNLMTILLSLIAVILALSYPLFKRFFAVPQLALGFAFNFGIIMAYAAQINHIPLSAWVLYLATIFWTISYDTMYALADKDYDLTLNLHSSAITFGKHNLLIMSIFQILTIICLATFGMLQHYNTIFFLSLVIIAVLFFYQHKTWQKGGIAQCIKAFSDNHWVGLVILLAILMQ